MLKLLTSTTELAEMMAAKTAVHIIDGTYTIPRTQGDAQSSHFECRIPGAKFFDVDTIADLKSPYPHTLPNLNTFIHYMKQFKIKCDDTPIVAYDQYGFWSASRIWYMFQIFGRGNVTILDGGLPKWKAEGRPTETGEYDIFPKVGANPNTEAVADYQYKLDESKIIKYEEIESVEGQIIDARRPDFFEGNVKEHHEGLPTGHIPGSINAFFKPIIFNKDNTFKSPEALRKAYEEHGVKFDDSVFTVHT